MDLMTRRRALLARVESGGRLPVEYQEVEYIESIGRQCIDTGFYIDQNSAVECKVLIEKNTQNRFYYGASQKYDTSAFECYVWNTDIQYNTQNIIGNIGISDLPDSFIGIIKHSKDGRILEYSNIVKSLPAVSISTFQTPKHLTLFALNRSGGLMFGVARIYYLKLYMDEELVEYLIPCYRKADSKPGMYDFASGTFLTNAGTGEFVVGADVN